MNRKPYIQNDLFPNPKYFKNKSLQTLSDTVDGIYRVEKWIDIADYEGLYQASSFGRIKRLKTVHIFSDRECIYPEKIVSQSLHSAVDGYLCVGLTKEKKLIIKLSHIYCCKAFHDNPENKPQVNHKNGVRDYNCEWNLEWNTNQENAIHAFKVLGRLGSNTGRFNEKHHRSKKVICTNNGIIYPSQHEAARQLGCSQSNITSVCTGKMLHTKGFVFNFVQ